MTLFTEWPHNHHQQSPKGWMSQAQKHVLHTSNVPLCWCFSFNLCRPLSSRAIETSSTAVTTGLFFCSSKKDEKNKTVECRKIEHHIRIMTHNDRVFENQDLQTMTCYLLPNIQYGLSSAETKVICKPANYFRADVCGKRNGSADNSLSLCFCTNMMQSA